MASELKPCPFCGGSNLSFRSTPDMDTDGKFHRISCNECGAGSREKFAMETCPLFYEELRNAWNTRPAPAATDTGLETVGKVDKYPHGTYFSQDIPEGSSLCLRSQAEELLAAERAESDEAYELGKRDGYSEAVQEIDLKTGGDGEYRYCTDHDPDRHTPDPASMIQRIVERFETLNTMESISEINEWKGRAEKAEADNAAKDAERAEQWRLRREMEADRDTQKAIAASLEAELAAERKNTAEAIREGLKAVAEVRADNAELTARIKEFGANYSNMETQLAKEVLRVEALEAKLAAANEVAQLVIQAEEDKSGDPNFYILLMQTAYDKARAVLGGKPS